jgi:hypothetical protein
MNSASGSIPPDISKNLSSKKSFIVSIFYRQTVS